jgi:Na+/H+-dicarboxylate symporter
VVAALEPVGTIFIRLITMVVVPIVVASLFTGVASLGDVRRLGRIGGRTLAYFVVTTVAAAVIGITVALVSGVGTGLDPAVRDAIAAASRLPGAAASTNVESVPTLLRPSSRWCRRTRSRPPRRATCWP